jgi:hypothetical protein
MLFSLAFETNSNRKSQILFSKSRMLWGARLVCGVYCKKGMRIGQGFHILLNPSFKIPFNEL